MLILSLIIFGLITFLDVLLLYTYLAIKQAHFISEVKKMFCQQNAWVFLFFNILHAILFAYSILNFHFFMLVCSLFTTSIYLFPKAIQYILNFKFSRKQPVNSKYNLTSKEEQVLLDKLKRGGATKEFIKNVKKELKEKK